MPYIKQKEFLRLVNDQQQLEKITRLLIQSLDNPPQDGICKVDDIAEDLVTRSKLLFKVNEDNVVLQKQLDETLDLLREVRVRAELEAEVNQEDLQKKLEELQEHVREVKMERNRLFYENESLKKIVQEHLSCQLTLMSILHGK